MGIYVTIHPFSEYLDSILQHSNIKGLRFNSAIPFKQTPREIIEILKKKTKNKELWIDLKGSELRISKEVTIPKDLIPLNHNISVKVPTAMYFNEGEKYLIVEEVIDGNKLKIAPPKNAPDDFKIKFGKGASLNIPDNSLKIEGYLTDNDINYIKASVDCDVHNYMISFVENLSDIKEVLDYDSDAKIVAKIESKKGLDFIKFRYQKVKDFVRLMAARGDLYIEIERPHEILNAMANIIKQDPEAILASRLLLSALDLKSIPSCADMTDIGFGIKLGYKNFMLGDHVCENEQALKSALGILVQILKDFS
ncbi:MAG: pyruvate kinase [Candidatus Helarchaeota archaeon]